MPQAGRGADHRAYWLLQTIRQAGFDVDLITGVSPRQDGSEIHALRGLVERARIFPPDHGSWLRAAHAWMRGEPFIRTREWQDAMAQQVREVGQGAALVVCVDAVHHQMIAPLLANKPRPFYLLDLGEPLSQRLITRATAQRGLTAWALRSEAKLLRSLESAAANSADLALVNDEIDLQITARRAPHASLWAVANGVNPTDGFSGDTITDLPNDVLFCGDLAIAAHQRAAVWLARTVMPLLRRHVPDARLVLMDYDLPKPIRRLGSLAWVELIDRADGGVPEALRMSRCIVGVAPQRQARGAAERTLMMMALARPVVCTSAVARTLPDETAAAPALAENGQQIAEATRRMLEDRKRAGHAGAQARRLVQQCGTWQQQWRRVGALLSQIASDERVRVTSDSPDPRDLAELRSATFTT
ncbi:MAG: glycosyltransferase [Phycisphaeraceae bacterium]